MTTTASLDLVNELASELPWQPPSRAVVTALRARVVASVAPARASWSPWVVAIGSALAAAATVVVWLVAREGEVPQNAAVVRAVASADYTLAAPGPDEQVRLRDGTIDVMVEPLRAGARFRVITGDAEVEVRGSELEVAADEDRLVAVRVISGRVEIRASASAPVTLGAGERWEADLVLAPPETETGTETGTETETETETGTGTGTETGTETETETETETGTETETETGTGTETAPSAHHGTHHRAPASRPPAPPAVPVSVPIPVPDAPAPAPVPAAAPAHAPAPMLATTVPAPPPAPPPTTPSAGTTSREDRREDQRQDRRDDRRDDRRQDRRDGRRQDVRDERRDDRRNR